MQKMKFFVLSLSFLVTSIVIFSLSKTWFVLDKGLKVPVETVVVDDKDDDPSLEEAATTKLSSPDQNDFFQNGKVYWESYFIFPVGLSLENSLSPGQESYLSHAKNLIFLNTKNGTYKSLFGSDLYIWDYFPGDVARSIPYPNNEEGKKDTLSLGKKLIILASNEDTNKDGFLNSRDLKRIYVFDPTTEQVLDILPPNHYYEKIYYNTEKNLLLLGVLFKSPETLSPPLKKIFVWESDKNRGNLFPHTPIPQEEPPKP